VSYVGLKSLGQIHPHNKKKKKREQTNKNNNNRKKNEWKNERAENRQMHK
jgi:hypothetical protein